jgi:alpha-ketoglutarate-dependent taurine dioxygenase
MLVRASVLDVTIVSLHTRANAMHLLRQQLLQPGQRGPLVISAASRGPNALLALTEYVPALRQDLLEHGALLFRGFPVDDVAAFDRVVRLLCGERMEYSFRSTPRTSLAPGIFTATEYPPQQEIPLHSENAYQRDWPLKVAFCCLTPPASGGETPIADLRRVTLALGTALVDTFESRRVRYAKHRRGGALL